MHEDPVNSDPTMPDAALDALLQADLLAVPTDFTQRVMAQVAQQSMASHPLRLFARQSRWRVGLQWLLVLAGTAAGVAQVLGFVFGMWSAMSAA